MNKRIDLNVLGAYLKRAFGRPFLFAVLATTFIYIFSTKSLIGTIRQDVYYYLFYVESFGVFLRLLYIFCAFPFSANYALEKNTGFHKFVLFRTGNKSYSFAQIILCAVSGGLALALGLVIFYLILIGNGIPFFDVSIDRQFAIGYDSLLIEGQVFLYFISVVYLKFLSGALWATVGLCISSYIRTTYIAIFSPIAVAYAYVELVKFLKVDNLFRIDRLLSIKYRMDNPYMSIFIATFVTLILIVIMGLIFSRKIQRDRGNE